MNIYDKGTGVALVNKKNEVLLGLRSDNQGWGLAGGKIENNEMPFEADRKSTRLNSSHSSQYRMPSSA